MNSSIWEHFASGSFSPSTSPAFLSGPGAAELARLRQELDEANGTIKQWEESWKQAKQVLGQLLRSEIKEGKGVGGCQPLNRSLPEAEVMRKAAGFTSRFS